MLRVHSIFMLFSTVVTVALSSAGAQSQTVTFQGEELEVFRMEHAYRIPVLPREIHSGTLLIDCMDALDAPYAHVEAVSWFDTDLVVFCMVTPSEDSSMPEFNPIFEYQIGPSVFVARWSSRLWVGSSKPTFRPGEVKMLFIALPLATRGEPFTLWYREAGVEAILEVREP